MRLRSIELQIDVLSDREIIGREEAEDLRRQARRLEQLLYRPSEREARDVEIAVQRLQEQLRYASAVGQTPRSPTRSASIAMRIAWVEELTPKTSISCARYVSTVF